MRSLGYHFSGNCEVELTLVSTETLRQSSPHPCFFSLTVLIFNFKLTLGQALHIYTYTLTYIYIITWHINVEMLKSILELVLLISYLSQSNDLSLAANVKLSVTQCNHDMLYSMYVRTDYRQNAITSQCVVRVVCTILRTHCRLWSESYSCCVIRSCHYVVPI